MSLPADDDYSDLDGLFKRTMPWLGDDFGMKDPQGLPGLSLVQWMNMQQNPSLANSMQPNYLHSLCGSVLQNVGGGADLSRQLGLPAPQQNTLQFGSQRPTQQGQQLDQLQKLPTTTLSPAGSIMQSQQQLSDISQQPRQNLINQSVPTNHVQAQLLQAQSLAQSQNVLQQQQSFQNQLQRNLPQNRPQQQQVMNQTQQQSFMPPQPSDPPNQQLHFSDNQIPMQLLQKLHQQQQSLLAQQSLMQQTSQLGPIQDQQKQLLDVSQNFSRSLATSQMLDMSQTTSTSTSLSQSQVAQQQMTINNTQPNLRFAQPNQHMKQQQQQGILPELPGQVGQVLPPTTNQLSANCSSYLTGPAGGGQSVITDDIPSCSTSPSTNNCLSAVQPIMNGRIHRGTAAADETTQSSLPLLSSSGLEAMSPNRNLVKDLQQKSDVKPSLNISKSHNHGFLTPQTYLSTAVPQMDYLDSSSSATSVCFSQNDVQLPQTTNPMSFSSQPVVFRDSQDGEVQGDPRNSVAFGANMDNQLGIPIMPDSLITNSLVGSRKDVSNNISSGGGMLSSYENPKDAQPELSSSMVSQSFGVPDMAFNSIDSTINEGSFMNRGAWAAPPQMPRMRTYTKVGNSICLPHIV